MASPKDIGLAELKAALTPENVRAGIIIQITLATGVLAFLLAVMFISQLPTERASNGGIIEIMNVIHAIFFIVAIFVAQQIFNRLLRSDELSVRTGEQVVQLIRTSYIIRAAVIEGAAFFGLATLLVAAQAGLLNTRPILWLNVSSAVYQILFILLNLPTAEKQEALFEERIQSLAT